MMEREIHSREIALVATRKHVDQRQTAAQEPINGDVRQVVKKEVASAVEEFLAMVPELTTLQTLRQDIDQITDRLLQFHPDDQGQVEELAIQKLMALTGLTARYELEAFILPRILHAQFIQRLQLLLQDLKRMGVLTDSHIPEALRDDFDRLLSIKKELEERIQQDDDEETSERVIDRARLESVGDRLRQLNRELEQALTH